MLPPALTGVVAGLVGLAVAQLSAAVLRARLSPVEAVGEAVIEVTPGGLAERAIDAVGQWDKPLLIAGVVLVMLLGCALAGMVGVRRRSAGVLVLVALAAVATMASVTRPDAAPTSLLPSIIGGGAGVLAYQWLMPRAAVLLERHPVEQLDRRGFLVASGGLIVAAAVVGGASRWIGQARRSVEQARGSLGLALGRVTSPAGADLGVPGVASWVTRTADFYRIDISLAPPLVSPKEWELRIHGMVDRELTLTFDELVARGLQDAWVTLCCVSNEVGGNLISNARWSGVRIDDLLAEAGVRPGADALLSTSHDGWTCGTPLSALTDGRDALLAVAMNGVPLPIEHGFPVRMVVPGLYGFVSATKWVVDWEVTRFADFTAYWTDRGWSADGPVKTQSRIDTPRSGDGRAAGPVRVGGVAWAQHTGIERVEVRVGEGDWQEATLAREPSIDSWVQWVYEWDAEPGDRTLAVRATDTAGYVQTGDPAGTVPDGATGWHTIDVTVG